MKHRLGKAVHTTEEPQDVLDIFLQPGELYFGDAGTRIRTLLGSCVAITLWHPRWHVGGMCHYMLPGRKLRSRDDVPDGRYADNALALLHAEIIRTGTRPADYTVRLIGGGRQFKASVHGAGFNVPERNIQVGRELLKRFGFAMPAEHIGGFGHRNVIFEVWSGEVRVRHSTPDGAVSQPAAQ